MAKKIPIGGGSSLASDVFASLSSVGLPAASSTPVGTSGAISSKSTKRGRVNLRIEKSGRSGKTVTVLFGAGVEALPDAEREELLKELKGSLGCGGAVDGALIELQGDVRDRASARLRDIGYGVK